MLYAIMYVRIQFRLYYCNVGMSAFKSRGTFPQRNINGVCNVYATLCTRCCNVTTYNKNLERACRSCDLCKILAAMWLRKKRFLARVGHSACTRDWRALGGWTRLEQARSITYTLCRYGNASIYNM